MDACMYVTLLRKEQQQFITWIGYFLCQCEPVEHLSTELNAGEATGVT